MGSGRVSLRRDEELRSAHSAFQSTLDKEKRREAERKAEQDRLRRVEVRHPRAQHRIQGLMPSLSNTSMSFLGELPAHANFCYSHYHAFKLITSNNSCVISFLGNSAGVQGMQRGHFSEALRRRRRRTGRWS